MTISIIIIAATILIAGFFGQRVFAERMRRYYDRPCTGRLWLNRFPEAKKEEVRSFLELFTSAFALKRKKKLSFAPDDRILDIYRTINPRVGGADALECETLVEECKQHYGVDITEGFSERTTLGDIFYAIRKAA